MPVLLRRDLTGIGSILDLGCGPRSPIADVRSGGQTVGVEAFGPYADQAVANRTHTHVVYSDFDELCFENKSFDAVVLLDVIEHLERDKALELMKKAERWARKLIVVTSPNGFVPQKALDGNPLQEHLSGWEYSEMLALGYECRGLAGLKWIRQEVDSTTMADDLLVTMRFRPKFLWFLVAVVSQPFTYVFPQFSFSIYSVKRVGSNS